tara:strand:+ start:323 stop:820 length:498 start_codon:yes stop_codon:yes gene_type:complete
MSDYIKEILITNTIHLNMDECSKSKNVDGLIKYKFKKENEKLCNKHGYVIEDSTKIINRSMGKLVNHDNKSMVEYKISVKLDIIYPCEKDIYTCKIDNITKMGVIGYLSNDKYNIENSPILFIIPTQYIDDTELLKKDMNIEIEVLQSRIKYKSNQIQVVGKLSK